LLGVSPLSLSTWQTALFLSPMFHHSNVRLPVETERWLGRLILTPCMHGIHHSIVFEERESNWSSGLTLWDRLNGTLRLNVPQAEITIGVPAYREPEEVILPKILNMPFREQRPTKDDLCLTSSVIRLIQSPRRSIYEPVVKVLAD
jgi:sterol desaturase/sphingolipid hydroxylase (fatty acid hydroxylase superfamily)